MATPDYDSVNNLLDLWKQTNVVTDNFFSYLFLFVVFLIAFIIMQSWDRRHVFVSSTLLTSLVAMLMFLAELIPSSAFTISLIAFGGGIMWLMFGSNEA